MESAYEAKKYEKEIYQRWEASGFFSPDKLPLLRQGFGGQASKRKDKFVVSIPPPNVTGSLHMGHALNNTIQDILVRYYRMNGRKVLWVPGTDHAGIATQFKVEQKLAKEGIRRFDLGREKFVAKVWEWKDHFEATILSQLKTLGVSCDWSRKRFTMDEEYTEAVTTAFKKYWDKGYIYQGKRVVNWCPRCHTSLSDLELEYKEEKAKLYWIKYGPFVLATTRPETKLGDTAVAVNPKDNRFKEMVGKKYKIPGVLGEFEVVVVADQSVDLEFGSGAVKVTPAHDAADAEIALRHNLPSKQIIDENGRMMANCGKYTGLKTTQAREAIVEDMTKMGLIDHIDENYIHNNAHCYRCGAIIEPLPSTQWFVKMDKLGKLAADAVKNKKIRITPERYEALYLNWLAKVRDWCISRQLWWGHQLPVYFCQIKTPLEKKMGFHKSIFCQIFKGKISTWRLRDHNFKAGDIVAFENSQTKEIFGYGMMTKIVKTSVGEIDLKDKSHYTTYKNRKELIKAFKFHNPSYEVNEKTPVFAYTYNFRKINATDGGCGKIIVSEKKPVKCSNCGAVEFKQSEDVLDTWFSSALWPFATLGWPKETKDLEEYYPIEFLSTAQDILYLWVTRMVFSSLEFTGKIPFKNVYIHPTVLALSGKRMSKSLGTGIDPLELVEKYGADATRLGLIYQTNREQQSFRFDERAVLSSRNFVNKLWNISRFIFMLNNEQKIKDEDIKVKSLILADQWILSRLNSIVESVSKKIEKYEFGEAAHELYDFTWHELADWYLEIAKLQDNSEKIKENTLNILKFAVLNVLKVLHPFIPFATETIWGEIIDNQNLLMVKEWPEFDKKKINKKIEQDFEKIKNLVIEIRNWKTTEKIPFKEIREYSAKKADKVIKENQDLIEQLAKVKLI